MPNIGKILMLLGLGLAALGLIIWLLGNKLNWFGNLPGDFRYEGKNVRIYAPFLSMLLLSLLISFVLWLIRRFF